jgi:hypothetical protein
MHHKHLPVFLAFVVLLAASSCGQRESPVVATGTLKEDAVGYYLAWDVGSESAWINWLSSVADTDAPHAEAVIAEACDKPSLDMRTGTESTHYYIGGMRLPEWQEGLSNPVLVVGHARLPLDKSSVGRSVLLAMDSALPSPHVMAEEKSQDGTVIAYRRYRIGQLAEQGGQLDAASRRQLP